MAEAHFPRNRCFIIRCCGAYTSTYCSIGFNGFPPLDAVVI